GDNLVNQPTEQCDGTASAACPGLCQPNCTCGTVAAPAQGTVVADATVSSSQPTTNLGAGPLLSVDAGPTQFETFVQVDVTGVGARAVTSARLRLQVATTTNAQSIAGGRI